jgi:hypothetical protein
MKTVLITLLITGIAALVAIKEDTAEALFHTFLWGCVIGFATLCTWISAKLRNNKINRLREDNRLRKARRESRVRVIESIAEEMEMVNN